MLGLEKKFHLEKFLIWKNFGFEKILGSENFWVQKFWSKNLGQKILGQKKLGQKK